MSVKIIGAILALIFVILGAIWAGYVITLLWLWFMCPLGLPEISLAHAVGVDLLITFITQKLVFDKKEADEDEVWSPIKQILKHLFVRPLFFLAAGYVAHFFM
jgi:hypothetical protein